LEIDGESVSRVRGNRHDVYSRGFLCAKGASLGKIDSDADRLRQPLVRRNGALETATWEEAFAEVDRLLTPILQEDRDAVATYVGNPTGHNVGAALYLPPLLKALGTRSCYTVATVDQMPKSVAAALLYGSPESVPVPDLDRLSYLVIIGANPVVSNGSILCAPDMPGRLAAIRARGGTVVVIDPARTKTADAADRHLAVRPGTDALLLLAVLRSLFAAGVDLGRLGGLVTGLDELEAIVRPFEPAAVADRCGIDADEIERLARELSESEGAAVYGRVGTTLSAHGTLTSWLIEVVNIVTGNLDHPGGAMFTTPVVGGPNSRGTPRYGPPIEFGRWRTRVRGLPECLGELPVSALAEEIATPGAGRVRALITVAGNPVLSTPNGASLDEALRALDALVCVDPYVNETTRHAHVILPPPSNLARGHYDIAIRLYAVRNVAHYSPPAIDLPEGALQEWEILARLTMIVAGDPDGDVGRFDDALAGRLAAAIAEELDQPLDDVLDAIARWRGPERLLDLRIRSGRHGDRFGRDPDGLTLAQLASSPNGIDLGPLEPRLPDLLRTPDGMIDLAPAVIVEEICALANTLGRGGLESLPRFELIGRRNGRSKNSWLRNIPTLMSGRPRNTLQMHPSDAIELALEDGATAVVSSAVGSVRANIEVCDGLRPGVVSLAHGWSDDLDGCRLGMAATRRGPNSNLLADTATIDPLSGTAVLNGIPVTIAPAEHDEMTR
jgi:anaerobic selenocysteine-containing dehydrogenase